MARCEDFPCCGHEPGCCPDFDEGGRQLNMVCTCGAKLPVNAKFSICNGCLDFGHADNDFDDEYDLDGFGDERGTKVEEIVEAMKQHYTAHGEEGVDFNDAAHYLRDASDEELRAEYAKWVVQG